VNTKLQTKSNLVDVNKISVRVNGSFITHALIDSGAQQSCIHIDLVKRLKLKIEHLPNTPSCLFSANGSPMPIFGQVLVDISVDNLHMPVYLNAMDKLAHKIILGVPFLQENKALIDMHANTVSFHDNTVCAPIKPRGRQYFVRTDHNIAIPPKSEGLICANIDSNFTLKTAIVEPTQNLFKNKIILAKAVISPQLSNSNRICCRILNISDEVVILKRGMKIATVEPVVISHVTSKETLEEVTVDTGKPDKPVSSFQTAEQILEATNITLNKAEMEPEVYDKLSQFLAQNTDIFALSLADLGRSNVGSHYIDTKDAAPIRRRIYEASPADKIEIEKQVEEMLQAKIIVPSLSAWSASVLLVKKKDNTKRFVLDFRALNNVPSIHITQ